MSERKEIPTKMKAATLVEPGRFECGEADVPEIGPDDALVEVAACGLCGTDIHIFRGNYSSEFLPMIPGHEIAGTVAAVGDKAGSVAVGDRVVVDNNIGCGHCYYCRRNQVLNCPDMRQIGIHRDGGYAEYVSVPARLLIKAPEDTPVEELAMTEPIACVVRATRRSGVRFGMSAAVIGCGPIGNLHVQMLRLVGAAPIIAVEPVAERARLAREAGADVVVTDAGAMREEVAKGTDGRGVDLAIEVVGKPELYRLAFELVRPGGHVAAFGLGGPDDSMSMGIQETVLQENSVAGSVAGMGEDMHDSLHLLTHGRFDLKPFTGDVRGLDAAQETFDKIAGEQDKLKVIFRP